MKSIDIHRGMRSVVATLAVLVAGCTGETALLTDISEPEANEVVAALDRANVPAHKQPGKEGAVSVMVDSAQVAQAVSTLADEGLPRERHAQMGEVFRKEGLISSPLEERARYLWALSQELSETISQIDGVIKARVHVVLPERASGGSPAQPSSASVFIKHRPEFVLQAVVPRIKQLVATSIPGLSDDRVTVVLVPAQAISQTPDARQGRTAAPSAAAASQAASGTPLLLPISMTRVAALGAVLAGLMLLAGVVFLLRRGLDKRRRETARQEPQITP